jgi:hypothetical protein
MRAENYGVCHLDLEHSLQAPDDRSSESYRIYTGAPVDGSVELSRSEMTRRQRVTGHHVGIHGSLGRLQATPPQLEHENGSDTPPLPPPPREGM